MSIREILERMAADSEPTDGQGYHPRLPGRVHGPDPEPYEGYEFVPAYLAGRCANGAERGRGRVLHLIPNPDKSYPLFGAALCGAKPGRLSAGWVVKEDALDHPATCQRCVSKGLDYFGNRKD